MASNVQSMLNILKPYWPEYDIEGHRNFWIVKPGGRCCGAGIIIKNQLDQILLAVNPSSLKETRYVVQKYIGKNGGLTSVPLRMKFYYFAELVFDFGFQNDLFLFTTLSSISGNGF